MEDKKELVGTTVDNEDNLKKVNNMMDNNSISFTDEELQEFVSYIRGDSVKEPEIIAKINANIKGKLIAGQTFYICSRLEQMPQLMSFMKEAESILYDKNKIITLSVPDLEKKYQSAISTLESTMEYGRKFFHANKSNWDQFTEKEDMVKKLLSGLTEDKLDKLIDLIKEGGF